MYGLGGTVVVFEIIKKDFEAVLKRDPAARGALEVLLCYPGFHSVIMHRIAHWFHSRNMYLIARMASCCNRFLTGIDIHPAAVVGEGLFIDHGIGIVIGETAEIGRNVTIYQGATLGGTGKDTGKRHPTIGNDVIISAGAKILGPFRIGDNVKVGAGSVVLKEVPPNCTVVGIPGRIVNREQRDPVQEQINQLKEQIRLLDTKIMELERTGVSV
jgi:serine O-acetyltransferase